MYPYITRELKNPITKQTKFYVQSARQHPVDIDTIAERIANSTTVSRADVLAVLAALDYEIKHCLGSGQSVRLGDLGSFYTRVKSEGVATQEECWEKGAKLIKHVTCCFQRSNTLSESLKPSALSFRPSDAEQARKEAAKKAKEEAGD